MTFVVLAIVALTQSEIEVPSMVDPLNRLLPTLGQRAGMKLFAAESVKGDVVGIASPKRPIRELMDGIAEAVNGTWEERKEGWVLLRTKAQEKEDVATGAAFRAKWMRRWLEQIPIEKPFGPQDAKALAAYRLEVKGRTSHSRNEFRELATMNARSPMGRFSRRLVEALGIERLAELADGNRKVLSTRPNRSQLLLNAKSIEEALQQFRAEQNLYAAAVSQGVDPQKPDYQQYFSGFDYVKAIPEGWDRIFLIVDSSNPHQVLVTLKLVDTNGNYLATAQSSLSQRGTYQSDASTPEPAVIEFTSETRELLASLKKPGGLTEAQRRQFANPVEREPLAFFNTEALGTLCEVKKKPVFVLFDDRQIAAYGVSTPYRLGQYLSNLTMWSTIADNERRILVRPSDPSTCAFNRINRAVFRDYVADFNRKGYISLENSITLSLATNSLSDYTLQAFTSLSLPLKFTGQPDNLLRIIALATKTERERLLTGGDVRFGEMNPAQRALMTRLVYNVEGYYPYTTVVDGKIPKVRATDVEVTEVCPNGLPDDVKFSVHFEGGDALKFKFDGETHAETLDSAVEYLYGRGPGTPTQFQYGSIRRLSLGLKVSQYIYTQGACTESRIDDDAPWKPYADLPTSIRTRMDELIRKRRAQYNLPPGPHQPSKRGRLQLRF